MKFQRIQDLRVDSDLSQKQIGEILHISQRSYMKNLLCHQSV